MLLFHPFKNILRVGLNSEWVSECEIPRIQGPWNVKGPTYVQFFQRITYIMISNY